jgi:ATP-binding cassette subfamily F protein 3
LDVDTVEALAEALVDYKGTVVFTSHDRHFMKRVATCIIEVRDSKVTNYRGDYEAYLYSVNKEIEDGERENAMARATLHSGSRPQHAKPSDKAPKSEAKAPKRSEREIRKEIGNLERNIARLDEQKKQLNTQLMNSTDPAEALKLHNEVGSLTTQLADAEERWLRLQEEVEDAL